MINEKVFRFYWLDGKTNLISGKTISEAFKKCGCSSGALMALDHYEEVEQLQDKDKIILTKEKSGYESFTNPIFIEQIKEQSFKNIGETITVKAYNREYLHKIIQKTGTHIILKYIE